MKLTQSVDQEELTELQVQWGPAPVETVTLAVRDPFLTGNHQLLTSNGRRAEICYVMHRGDPREGVLLHRKTIYPVDAYRLPTGGIHQGEPVLETLAREIEEETGLLVGATADSVLLQRFLGVVHYSLHQVDVGRTDSFATYHFLVQMPEGAILEPQDPDEMIADWRWIPAVELDSVADALAAVGGIAQDWADWGHFRAVSHRFVTRRLIGAG